MNDQPPPDDPDASGPNGGESVELNRKIKRLHDATTRIQSATERSTVYDLTVKAAVDILGFDWCALQLVREGRFEVVAVSDRAPIEPGDRPLAVDEGITGKVYRTGESTVTEDVREEEAAAPTQVEFRSGLSVPLDDRGVFQGISSVPGFFDEDDLELAELLIAHAESALRRIEETERLERLHDATRRLMTVESETAIAEIGSDTVSEVLEFPLNAVYLYDETRATLEPVAASERSDERFDEIPSIGPDEGVSWSVYRSGSTRVYDDVREAPEVYNPSTPVRSELITPLGEHGVLVIGSTVPGEFDDTDVTLAETLAANIEVALDRADQERDRREQRRQLERQNERLDRFASVVSHDLRNPLNVVRGRLELASEECDSGHLAPAIDAVDRMEAIIEDTLTLARQGRTVADREPVDIGELVEECWHQAGPGDATLEVDTDLRLRGDPDRLKHVFENLFRNAVEHAGDDVTVRVDTLPEDAGFYVEDDGPGIPPEDRETVFESGYSTADDGTGFGLAIVKEIVEAHGWDIAVTEGTDGGARFEITGIERPA